MGMTERTMEYRKHQKEIAGIIDEIIDGRSTKTIICSCVPGSGKSMLPLIAGKLITAGLVDALCWIVPRLTLSYQAESNFTDPAFRELLNHKLTIRASTNDSNPCRGLQGFTSTYQALAVDDKQTVLSDFRSKRYILVLDEVHHVSNEAEIAWYKAIKPLVDAATFLILLSGTMQRGDGKQIAFIRYDQVGKNLYPRMQPDETTAVIEYTRREALSEKAILPLSFHLSSGTAHWINKEGALCESDVAQAPKDIAPQALFTAISTEFAETLLEKGIAHWQKIKERNAGAKLLIVTANYAEAKKIARNLKAKWHNSEIATSHESVQAHQAIKRFKNGTVDVLVSINMVAEGLDVPSVTHIICLTNIRSVPWIEQMVARAVRVDPNAGPYETQCAYIYAPDDVFFREIVSKIKREQRPFVKMHQKTQMKLFDNPEDGDGVPAFQIQPLSSTLTGNREVFLGNKEILPELSIPQTPSEIEASLRDRIEGHVRLFSFNNRYRNGEINSAIKTWAGKPRAEMTAAELEQTYEYIIGAYPISLVGRGSGRHRVPTKAEIWPN